LYFDLPSKVPAGSTVKSDTDSGRALYYLADFSPVDVRYSGAISRLELDRLFYAPLAPCIVATDFPLASPPSPAYMNADLQGAIDSLALTGGTLCLPPGDYAVAQALQFTSSTKPITLQGSGVEGCRLLAQGANVDLISVAANNITIQDMTLN